MIESNKLDEIGIAEGKKKKKEIMTPGKIVKHVKWLKRVKQAM